MISVLTREFASPCTMVCTRRACLVELDNGPAMSTVAKIAKEMKKADVGIVKLTVSAALPKLKRVDATRKQATARKLELISNSVHPKYGGQLVAPCC